MFARSSASGEAGVANQASRISPRTASEVVRRESASTFASFHLRAPSAVAAGVPVETVAQRIRVRR